MSDEEYKRDRKLILEALKRHEKYNDKNEKQNDKQWAAIDVIRTAVVNTEKAVITLHGKTNWRQLLSAGIFAVATVVIVVFKLIGD